MESLRAILKNGDDPKVPGMVRFVCLSDTHNTTEYMNVPAGDVLLHSGDFTRQGHPEDVRHFNRFLASLSFTHKIVIAGNHDLTFDLENFEQIQRTFGLRGIDPVATKGMLRDCTYLEDSGTCVFGYKVWGSPWQPTFCNWGFNLDIGPAINGKWALIPTDTEILLTHGPPGGVLDTCSDGYRAGCPFLLKKIQEVKPLVHVFGHIHEAYGTQELSGTLFINASNCNLRYRPVNKPIVFDLPIKQ